MSSERKIPKRIYKILIADDHPAVRYGVRSILQLEPNLTIIGEASSGDEAINILDSRDFL